ncbi:MAG: hypothetical protein IPP97_26645 [Candidatus Obscuribacter sp.]|nr:hypothetical protein [Candidatus Obscuribacter sp.]
MNPDASHTACASLIKFEDPDYNRLLASVPKKKSRQITLRNSKAALFTVSVDRQEYNADSDISFLCDASTAITSADVPQRKLEILRLNENGVAVPIMENPAMNLGEVVNIQLSKVKPDLEPKLKAGDTLLIVVTIEDGVQFVLSVPIVAEPVIAPPTSAYALLRRAWTISGTDEVVECRAFAWSPAPERFELTCPSDLLGDLVRRRAVFRWTDTMRPAEQDSQYSYTIQKITPNGSTYIPDLDEFLPVST